MDEKLKLYTLKKLKKQIEFLRLELQETQYIFDKALTEFNSDFSDTLQEGKPINPQKIQLTDQEEKECNFLFRRIATITHPDKLGNNSKIEEKDKKKLEELYKESNEASDRDENDVESNEDLVREATTWPQTLIFPEGCPNSFK